MSLVDRIRDLATSKHLTIAELERKIGISNGQIRKWDTSSPSIEKIKLVADYFNVSTDYLLDRTDWSEYDRVQDIPKLVELVDIYENSLKRVDLKVILEDQIGLNYGGKEISEEDMGTIESVLKALLKQKGYDVN